MPQLTVCGPCPEGFPEEHPSQFQVYVAPGNALPVKVIVAFVLMQVLLGLTLKEEVGLAFTVTNCVVTAETQLVGAGPVTVKVNVLTPEVDQLAVQGPAVVPGAGVHPLQFQAKLDPAGALPVYVSVALPPAQTGEEAEKVEVGGATTFTAAVTGVETQLVGAGPVTVNVIFLTPGVDQLTRCGPAVAAIPPWQLSQFQV